MNIKIFSDFSCPFCYIGFSIAERLKEEHPEINIEWLPYELDPGLSEEGADLTKRIPKEKIDMSFRRIERLGSEYGLIYNNRYKKFNTHKLHKGALYAEKEGKFYEFAKEAFKAIFEYGKNVSESAVLNEIGLKAGLNIVEMNNCISSDAFDEVFEESNKLVSVFEVDSVPTFIVNDSKKVTLLKEYKKFKKDLLED